MDFQSQYQDLGSKSVDDAFDEQEVESDCCIMSTTVTCEDSVYIRWGN